MDKKKLEEIKDVFTCIKIADVIHAVKPEWDMQVLKYCLDLATPSERLPADKTQSSDQRPPQS